MLSTADGEDGKLLLQLLHPLHHVGAIIVRDPDEVAAGQPGLGEGGQLVLDVGPGVAVRQHHGAQAELLPGPLVDEGDGEAEQGDAAARVRPDVRSASLELLRLAEQLLDPLHGPLVQPRHALCVGLPTQQVHAALRGDADEAGEAGALGEVEGQGVGGDHLHEGGVEALVDLGPGHELGLAGEGLGEGLGGLGLFLLLLLLLLGVGEGGLVPVQGQLVASAAQVGDEV